LIKLQGLIKTCPPSLLSNYLSREPYLARGFEGSFFRVVRREEAAMAATNGKSDSSPGNSSFIKIKIVITWYDFTIIPFIIRIIVEKIYNLDIFYKYLLLIEKFLRKEILIYFCKNYFTVFSD
jgi:hypothetical protein